MDAIIVLTVDVETVRAILWQPSPLGATGTQVSIEMSSRAEGPRALAVRVVDMLRARLAEPAEPREVPLAVVVRYFSCLKTICPALTS